MEKRLHSSFVVLEKLSDMKMYLCNDKLSRVTYSDRH